MYEGWSLVFLAAASVLASTSLYRFLRPINAVLTQYHTERIRNVHTGALGRLQRVMRDPHNGSEVWRVVYDSEPTTSFAGLPDDFELMS